MAMRLPGTNKVPLAFPFLVVALLLQIGCGDSSTDPDSVSLNGRWVGTTTFEELTVDVTLRERRGTVTGSGSLRFANGTSLAVEVNGTRAKMDISFSMTADGYSPLNFSGTILIDSVFGTLNGSGFEDKPITLERQ